VWYKCYKKYQCAIKYFASGTVCVSGTNQHLFAKINARISNNRKLCRCSPAHSFSHGLCQDFNSWLSLPLYLPPFLPSPVLFSSLLYLKRTGSKSCLTVSQHLQHKSNQRRRVLQLRCVNQGDEFVESGFTHTHTQS